jgi:polyhydroxyalkanoate synthesis repressor PhaR
MIEPRVSKKYPNRRLYDTVESRYITLADIRRLVMDKIDFVVIDKKSQDDITRPILLQVISEQEHSGEPLLSQEFMSQVIRAYGGTMHGVVGRYLEQSLKLLAAQQLQLRDHARGVTNSEADSIANSTQKNLDRWRSVQDDIFRAVSAPPAAPRPKEREDNQDESREKRL